MDVLAWVRWAWVRSYVCTCGCATHLDAERTRSLFHPSIPTSPYPSPFLTIGMPSSIRTRLPTDSDELLAVAVALVAGLFVALMIRLNATLGEHIGVLEGSFVVHLVGTGFAALLLLPRGRRAIGGAVRDAPGYAFVGGVLGVVIVMLANVVVPVLGVALTLSLSVAANLSFSTLSDHFGWFGLPAFRVSTRRVVGLLLVLVGVLLVAFG